MHMDLWTDPDFDWPSLFVTKASPEKVWCGSQNDGWICTRPAEHEGDHVAHGGNQTYATWDNKGKEPKEPSIVIRMHVEN